MSRYHTETITCPKCGAEGEFRIWDSVNTTLDPELKEKVRSGELFVWTCPGCGSKITVDYPTLYHQMEDRVMIYYAPNEMEETAAALKGLFRDADGEFKEIKEINLDYNYTKRVVATKNQFREKLVILDEGLDDRVVELTKAYMRAALYQQDPDMIINEFLLDAENGKRIFALHLADGRWATSGFAQDLYDFFADRYKAELESNKDVIIDYDWAAGMISPEE